MITITCNRCGETTSGQYRIKSGRKYYDCQACGRSMRLIEYPQNGGPTLLVPAPTGRPNRNMQTVTMWMRRDIMAELRKLPNYSETVNLVLAKHLGL